MTKKHASVLFAFLCTLLCASPLFACTPAEEPWVIRETFPEQLRRSGEYQYAFSPERGEAAITNYLGTAEEVVVPAELDGHPVTEVRSLNNIYTKGTFKRVVLPDGLVEIGAEAFAQTRLEAVTIPDSVQRIGVDAFFGTPWLEAQTDEFVIVGDGVLIDYNTADDNPLNETNNLDIPDGVRFIAFRLSQTPIQMYRRHTVTIPGSVRAIGEDAFSNVRIEKLTISDGLQEIGDRAFYCSLETDHITLPNSVTHIGDEAFALNNTLKAAFLGNRTECIGAEAFAYCRSLQKITLPPTVACVGPGAFDGTAYRDGLTDEFVILGDGVLIDYNGNDKDVVVPEGVKFITDAFRDQPVEHVTLPDSLLRIGENAFAASALQSVRFADGFRLHRIAGALTHMCCNFLPRPVYNHRRHFYAAFHLPKHPIYDRPACHRVQSGWRFRMHPAAASGCQDYCCFCLHGIPFPLLMQSSLFYCKFFRIPLSRQAAIAYKYISVRLSLKRLAAVAQAILPCNAGTALLLHGFHQSSKGKGAASLREQAYPFCFF